MIHHVYVKKYFGVFDDRCDSAELLLVGIELIRNDKPSPPVAVVVARRGLSPLPLPSEVLLPFFDVGFLDDVDEGPAGATGNVCGRRPDDVFVVVGIDVSTSRSSLVT